jgi:hypothetical protein
VGYGLDATAGEVEIGDGGVVENTEGVKTFRRYVD